MNTKIFIRVVALCAMVLFFAGKNKKTWNTEKFSIRSVEKSMAKVTDKLYACKYEATNLEYRTFLEELKANRQFDLYKQSLIDSTNWRDKAAYNEPFVSLYHTHPAYNKYPVVNITHNGAENFCKWLTNKYNVYPKRKFKKVIFRLPTENEWIRAAKDSLRKNNYGIDYPLMSPDGNKGCNFRYVSQKNVYLNRKKGELSIKSDTVHEDKKSGVVTIGSFKLKNSNNEVAFWSSDYAYHIYNIYDPLSTTEPVDSYTPNSLGIYNMLGNAAEMIQEKGRTKGGCWESTGYFLSPYAEDEFRGFTGSSPFIGFRYFMEVVEQ